MKAYNQNVIASFGDQATADLYHGRSTNRVRRFPTEILGVCLRKLDILNGAAKLIDLGSLPANRLKPLKGKWKGFHSIRVNDQWRIVFRWQNDNAHEVRLIDYH